MQLEAMNARSQWLKPSKISGVRGRESPLSSRVQGRSMVGGLRDEVPKTLSFFVVRMLNVKRSCKLEGRWLLKCALALRYPSVERNNVNVLLLQG